MELVKVNFDTDDIIQAIIKCHELYKGDTVGIAQKLKGSNLVATCSNIHDYVYKNIKYKLDENGVQFAKRPNRTLTEKVGDCKSMSLLAGSILYNLGIPFSFRFASYDGKEYTHVYIVAHGNRNVIIDPVWTLSGGAFDTEKQYVGKPKDYEMRPALYIGSTKRVGEISDKDLFAKYFPPVADMLVRLNRIVDTIALPEYKANAKAFLQVVGAEARNDQSKLLIFNGYANVFLSGKKDWATTFKALAVVLAWKAPLGVGNIFSDAWESTKDFVQNVGDNVGDKFRQFTDWAGNVIRDSAEAAASAAKRVVNKARDVTVSFTSWGAQGISDFVKDPQKFLKTEVASLKENAQKTWEAIKTVSLAPARIAFIGLVKLNVFSLASRIDESDKEPLGEKWAQFGGNRTELFNAAKENANKPRIFGIGETSVAAMIASAGTLLAAISSIIKEAKGVKDQAVGVKSDFEKLKNDINNAINPSDKKGGIELLDKINYLEDLGGNPNKQGGFPMWGLALVGVGVVGVAVVAKRRK